MNSRYMGVSKELFAEIIDNKKRILVLKDIGFRIGDFLYMHEIGYKPYQSKGEIKSRICNLDRESKGIEPDYCIVEIKLWEYIR